MEETHHEDVEFIAPMFVTTKKDWSYRFKLNPKDLDQYIEYNDFEMHDLQEILKLVTPLCKMASLDIKDAYYSIPVNESFQKYSKFYWNHKLYQFCALPNGLSPCTRWFTKLLKPPPAELKKNPHCLSAYIDDVFLRGEKD